MDRTCRRCGAPALGDEGDLPPGWSLDTDDGAPRLLCAACTRANIASIEARLAPEWWEG